MDAHVFVDAENINPKVFDMGYTDLNKDYNIVKIDIFGKENHIPIKYKQYQDNKFNFVNCHYGKNSADTFMTAYIVKSVYEEPSTDIFIIMSQDRDFIPAVKIITENNKKVILVSEKNKQMDILESIGMGLQYVKVMEYDIQSWIKADIKPTSVLTKYDTSKTVFLVGENNKITEVFFNNGMTMNDFMASMYRNTIKRIRKGYSNKVKIKDILYKNYINVIDDRLYIDLNRI